MKANSQKQRCLALRFPSIIVTKHAKKKKCPKEKSSNIFFTTKGGINLNKILKVSKNITLKEINQNLNIF